MLFAVWPWFLHADKFRQSMGNSRWPCHGLSRSVTAFSDNAQDLSIVFCLLSRFVTVCHGLSRFVTQHVRQFEANMNLFPITCNLRLLHFDNACAICDHQKWLHYLHAFPIWPYLCAWILRDIYIHTYIYYTFLYCIQKYIVLVYGCLVNCPLNQSNEGWQNI